MPKDKRLERVRLHIVDSGPSVEGLMRRRRPVRDGHYTVYDPQLIVREGESQTLDVAWLRVPEGRVLYYEGKGA